MKFNN